MRTKEYDLVVLGTGDAGQTVALAAAKKNGMLPLLKKRPSAGPVPSGDACPKRCLSVEKSLSISVSGWLQLAFPP